MYILKGTSTVLIFTRIVLTLMVWHHHMLIGLFYYQIILFNLVSLGFPKRKQLGFNRKQNGSEMERTVQFPINFSSL